MIYNMTLKMSCVCNCNWNSNCDCNYLKFGRQPLERLQPDYGQSWYRGLVVGCEQELGRVACMCKCLIA